MSWKTGLFLHAPEEAIRERARGLKQYLDEVSSGCASISRSLTRSGQRKLSRYATRASTLWRTLHTQFLWLSRVWTLFSHWIKRSIPLSLGTLLQFKACESLRNCSKHWNTWASILPDDSNVAHDLYKSYWNKFEVMLLLPFSLNLSKRLFVF